MNGSRTVGDLVALIDRTAKALHEVGETALAERCHVRVLADGRVLLSFDSLPPGGSPPPVVEKAISLDPVFWVVTP